jgi:NAD(P)H-flavin reductase
VLVYGAFYPQDFPFLDEIEGWRQSHIEVILTVDHPEGLSWKGKTGWVQSHFGQAVKGLSQPVALICGMKAMMEQSREELIRLGIEATEILTNY